ncbi:MAG: HlyD family efflux transporter periplasmic adaptor subunit [Planctomycetaceae bacterium]|nr:HlyD family efflux transporter periplasmic adaptor subunit [Planctomycetaceae bacterium]
MLQFRSDVLSRTAIGCWCSALVTVAACGVFSPWAQGQDDFNAPGAVPVSETRIEILDKVEISVEVPGRIVDLQPKELGAIVEKGQLVVQLNDEVIQAELNEARKKADSTILIEFAEIKRDLAELDLNERIEKNKVTPGLFTVSELRRYELEWEQGKAECAKATYEKEVLELAVVTKETQLNQYRRFAELGGIVTDFHDKAVGSEVRPGDPLMTVVDLNRVKAALTVDPRYEDQINVGDTVLIRRTHERPAGGNGNANDFLKTSVTPGAAADESTLANEVFRGVVTLISPTNKTDGDLQVYATVDNKSTGRGKFLLRQGSFVESVIIPAR